MKAVTPDGANRMAIGFARARGLRYEEAEAELRRLSIRIVWTIEGPGSLAEQLALLTAANTASRAFLGGVQVDVPRDIPMIPVISGVATLRDALRWTGVESTALLSPTCTLYIGLPEACAQSDDVVVYCDSWRAGVSNVRDLVPFRKGDRDRLGLGGVLAGALGVHRSFVRATHLPSQCLDEAWGVSLWNPLADWHAPETSIRLRQLPVRFWMLGLGHLGQSYLWNLAFLPFPESSAVEFLLQDFDQITESNFGSGLLCQPGAAGRKKSRHCADWLESMGFSTRISERRFTIDDRRGEDEPFVAFCGFDNVPARLGLDTAGLGLILECGLGGSLADFDQLDFHTFPSLRHTATSLWGAFDDKKPKISPQVAKLFSPTSDEICGALAIDVAGKSVSTSFVGAIAGAWATAEMLRVFNWGERFDDLSIDLRNPRRSRFLTNARQFTASELGAMRVMSVAS